MLDIAAICLVVTALLSYLNHRFVRLPTTIGVMVIALGFSLLIVALSAAGLDHGLRRYEESFLRTLDFSEVLMQGMLSFLLFAGRSTWTSPRSNSTVLRWRAWRWWERCSPRCLLAWGCGWRCRFWACRCRFCTACCLAR
jgi:hypothetical protein